MSGLRPGTASKLKNAQLQQQQSSIGSPGGTARVMDKPPGLSTSCSTSLNRRGGFTGLNAPINFEDRPITQQGLTGIQPASTSTGTRTSTAFTAMAKRLNTDDGNNKTYHLAALRAKIGQLEQEIDRLANKTESMQAETDSYAQYADTAERLAVDIKDLQGQLGDYNTLVDKTTLGESLASVELDCEQVRACNERVERSLELLFDEKQRRQARLKAVEMELKQEQQLTDSMLHSLSEHDQQTYYQLRDLNEHLIKQLHEGQDQLEQLAVRRVELENDLELSQIKQEAWRCLARLKQAEAKRDHLRSELDPQEDPQHERERLLAQVKADNQGIASMERQSCELKEKIKARQEEVEAIEHELDTGRNERAQKVRELKRREQQIDEFMKTFDEVKDHELTTLAELESIIMDLLSTTSRNLDHVAQLTSAGTSPADVIGGGDTATGSKQGLVNQMRDQLGIQSTELVKSQQTVTALGQERARLSQDLQKIDQLEVKVLKETEMLKQRIETMNNEIEIYTNLDKVKETNDQKLKEVGRLKLTEVKQRLEASRDALARHNLQLSVSNEQKDEDVDVDPQSRLRLATVKQLASLEPRWRELEQSNYALDRELRRLRSETDSTSQAKRALDLCRTYNEELKASLVNKPLVPVGEMV